MERDFIGYGNQLPIVKWPQQGRVALNFVLNYEEGAERNIMDGDDQAEDYLIDWPKYTTIQGKRSLSSESLFEYGSRVGVWRLLSLFDEYKLPLTLFATGLALERNLPLAHQLKLSTHEIAGHGYRWINYSQMDESLEREHIQKTMRVIQSLTGKKVKGWYTGRVSDNTRKLIVEANLVYDSDSYSDDLPYWMKVNDKKHLIIPYALDTNDARYATCPGWDTGAAFFQYLKDTFDALYLEGKTDPKMMTVGLHSRFSGRPGRCQQLKNFLEYVLKFNHVWICRREEIADYWMNDHA